MEEQRSPLVVAPRLSSPPGAELDGWLHAFVDAPGVPLLGRFPGGDASAESSGTVKMAWSGTSIHIFADLKDDHIATTATQFNDPLYLLGDCFEIFLQAKNDAPYLEFHVAPNNLVLQLLYPSPADFAAHCKLPIAEFCERFTIKKPVFTSRTWQAPHANRWQVAATIDLRLLIPTLTSLDDRECQFLFGRYDYPPESRPPVLTCSSILMRADFHRQEDWGSLTFRR